MKRVLFSSLSLVLTLTSMVAEGELPEGPIAASMPTPAAWKVTYEKPKESEGRAASDSPVSTTVTKSGTTFHEVTVWLSGKTSEKWVLDGVQLLQMPGTQTVVPIPAPTAEFPQPDYSDYGRGDFPELAWLTRANYQGTVSHEGRSLWEFREGPRAALVDPVSRFPVRFEDGAKVLLYAKLPDPVENLTPPALFLKTLEAWNRGRKALQFQSSPP